MDEQLQKAVEIVAMLQGWIEDVHGLNSTPVAHLTWSDRTLEIGIGEIGLWSDQGDSDEELNFAELRKRYIDRVENLAIACRLVEPSESA